MTPKDLSSTPKARKNQYGTKAPARPAPKLSTTASADILVTKTPVLLDILCSAVRGWCCSVIARYTNKSAMLKPMVKMKSGLYESTALQLLSSWRNCGSPLAKAPREPMIDPTQELIAKIWLRFSGWHFSAS